LGTKQRSRLGRLGVLLLRVALLATVTFGAIEVGFRYFLFAGDGSSTLARKLRNAESYTHRSRSEYWKLRWLLAAPDRRRQPPRSDSGVGWVTGTVEPETYEHDDAATLGERRPILLYGDSFAECRTAPEDCWQGLLEETEAGRSQRIINYGSSSYGVSQMVMLFLRSIELYADKNPLVILAIFVDNDLDRSSIEFRGWPKPRVYLEGDKLQIEDSVTLDTDTYLRENPVGIQSYAWRYLVFGLDVFSPKQRMQMYERDWSTGSTKALNRALLREFKRECDARGLEHFVVLFHGQKFIDKPDWDDWREQFLIHTMRSMNIPWVSSRQLIEAAMAATQRDSKG